ncbi:MAG TPA: hypothetical protein VF490_15165 [Chryseosolibacter sp.]
MKRYKREFDRDLRHIKLILAQERHKLPVSEWLHLVQETKECILRHPREFFCHELPPEPLVSTVLEKVFDRFLEDQRLLALQTSKGFRKPRPHTDLLC